jgi:hypothetical protein
MRFAPARVPVPVPPHRQWLAIVGSVASRATATRAMYALFDEMAFS